MNTKYLFFKFQRIMFREGVPEKPNTTSRAMLALVLTGLMTQAGCAGRQTQLNTTAKPTANEKAKNTTLVVNPKARRLVEKVIEDEDIYHNGTILETYEQWEDEEAYANGSIERYRQEGRNSKGHARQLK